MSNSYNRRVSTINITKPTAIIKIILEFSTEIKKRTLSLCSMCSMVQKIVLIIKVMV